MIGNDDGNLDLDGAFLKAGAAPTALQPGGIGRGVPVSAELFSGCPHASKLLGRVAGGDLTCDFVMRMVTGFRSALQTSATADVAASTEDAIDLLETLLDDCIERKLLASSDLAHGQEGARAASRAAHRLALAVERVRNGGADSTGSGQSTTSEQRFTSDLSRTFALQAAHRLTAAEEKVAPEIFASNTRLEKVVASEPVRVALDSFASYMESGATDEAKVKAWSDVQGDYDLVALMRASQLKEPRGELAANPHALHCVTRARAARGGLMVALRNVIRRMVPQSADVAPMVEAIFIGKLVQDSGFSVESLASPTVAKAWLGVKAAAASDTSAASRGNMTAVLIQAQNLLSYTLGIVHPGDVSISSALADANSLVALAIRSRTVKEAVAGILVPLFRAYGEAFDAFQRSATMSMPTLGAVWAKEKEEPAMARFVQLISAAPDGGRPDSAPAQPAEWAKALKEIKELKQGVAKTAKVVESVRGRVNSLTDDEGDGEGGAGAKPKSRSAEKKARQKKAKEAEAAKANGSAAAANDGE